MLVQKNPKNVREKPFRLNFQKTFVKVCQVACKPIFSLIRLQVPLKQQRSENSFNEKFWSSAPHISQCKLIDETWFLIQTVWRTFTKASLEHFFIEKNYILHQNCNSTQVKWHQPLNPTAVLGYSRNPWHTFTSCKKLLTSTLSAEWLSDWKEQQQPYRQQQLLQSAS